MKLLFDENLSFRLVALLSDVYPGSTHVDLIRLRAAPDLAIWEYARSNGFALVSKDDDFRHLSLVHGSPPKVIWLRVGNLSTMKVEEFLRGRRQVIAMFADSTADSLLLLTKG